MSQLPDSAILLLLVFLVILLILCAIIAWTIRVSFRLRKLVSPRFRMLFVVGFLQVFWGMLILWIIREINYNAVLAIGSGAGLAILTGLFSMKWFFKFGWKKTLGIWSIATGLQIVIVPILVWVMLIGWAMLAYLIDPPLL